MRSPKLGRKPNIMIMILDTVRADHCSAWGYGRKTTPGLARLAETSTVYTQAISPSAWTLPAHISLFTGLFPSEHGVLTEQDGLRENTPFLAEILRNAGYRTAGFTNNPWASSLCGLERGFDSFEEVFRGARGRDRRWWRKNLGRVQRFLFLKDGGAEETNSRVMEWIKRWDCEHERAPFFVFVNYMDAHQAYAPKHPFHRKFGGWPSSYVETLRNRNVARGKAGVYAGTWRLTAQDYTAMVNMYDRAIAYLDFRIEELVDFLDGHDLLDNTLLIITSDHGENFGEHSLAGVRLIDHLFSLYDSLIRIPLLVRWSETFGGGEQRTDLVQLHDVFYLITGLLNLDEGSLSKQREGTLLGDRKREYAFAEHVTRPKILEMFRRRQPGQTFDRFDVDLKAIRTTDHKLIKFRDGREEFYDLQNDPGETVDLSQQGNRAPAHLVDSLDQWLAGLPVRETSTEPYDLLEDEAIRRRLADLGYL
jgi:arylsulfatase A-like enzyme